MYLNKIFSAPSLTIPLFSPLHTGGRQFFACTHTCATLLTPARRGRLVWAAAGRAGVLLTPAHRGTTREAGLAPLFITYHPCTQGTTRHEQRRQPALRYHPCTQGTTGLECLLQWGIPSHPCTQGDNHTSSRARPRTCFSPLHTRESPAHLHLFDFSQFLTPARRGLRLVQSSMPAISASHPCAQGTTSWLNIFFRLFFSHPCTQGDDRLSVTAHHHTIFSPLHTGCPLRRYSDV